MKLIRLTSDDPNGTIETNFSQDIEIKENSKIALMNTSFSVSEDRFLIDQYNHLISYFSNNSGNEDARTDIFLDKLSYIKETATELLDDITNKFNDNLKENTQNIGSQVRVATEGGKTTATTKICPNNGQLFYDFLNTPNALNTNITSTITNQNNLSLSKNTASSNDDSGACASFFEFGKGYSSLRARIELLDKNVGDTTINGFMIGLSTTSPSDWTLTNNEYSASDKTYYIHIADPSLADHIYTKTDGGGEVATGIQLDRDVNNNAISKANYIQIDKNGKNLEFRLYRASQAVADLLLSVPMADRNIKLYPFYILKGSVNILKLDTVKYTLDPYTTTLTKYLNPLLDDTEYQGVGAIPKTITQRRTIKTIVFQSSILANFLGFESNILSNNNNRYAGQFFNKATNQFKILIQNPYFIIKMNNIDLESFDADSKGRFNILSTFGNEQENSTRSIFYEASNPIFLDIKNSTPRSLRNIRIQILNSDLTKTSTDGFSSITLLLND